MKILYWVFCLCLFEYSGGQFTIDYEGGTFLMNEQPYRYVSGSAHYFRMPRQYWRDRLRKMAAAGLNAVSTYVEWSQHEREPGVYDFSGDLNITEFVRTAEEEGLHVILRVGPYICAEREMGGFPYWLLREHPDIKLRVNDPHYTRYLETWLDVLLPHVQPLLFGNGGPIITVQVENEYGFYGQCDHSYTSWLASIFKKYIGDKALLFTTDGSDFNSLSCGKIPDVYATVDFGPGANVTEMFLNHKAVEPKGPFVNSEFYPGWLTHWGENWARRDTVGVLETLKDILDIGGNVNMYMFYGGTNFGFSAGANFGSTYQSDLTSYDYDAPISEAGDLTPKYLAIRDFLLSYLDLNTTLPKNPPKGDYGDVELEIFAKMGASFTSTILGSVPYELDYPLSFEALSQDQGYMLYETISPVSGTDITLELTVQDIAHIYINSSFAGVLSREFETTKLSVTLKKGDTISIFVENSGRINFGDRNNDFKGILSNVTLSDTVLDNWTVIGYDFDNLDLLSNICPINNTCMDGPGFNIYKGAFTAEVLSNIEYNGQQLLADTFLNVSGLNKGVVFVNNINIGRYWSTRGPQYSVYIPGAYLKKENSIIIIEEQIDSEKLQVLFSTFPIIGDPKPIENVFKTAM